MPESHVTSRSIIFIHTPVRGVHGTLCGVVQGVFQTDIDDCGGG